jgi:hypothetical protein
MDANATKTKQQLSASTALSVDNLNAPWSLHFDRDGTEDVAIICDANGHDLVRSRHFWLPEGDDPIPPTLAAMRLMVAAPKLLAALKYALEFLEANDDGEEDITARIADARAAIATATAVSPDGGRL